MISEKFLKLFKLHLRWASYFSATPIVWNREKNVPEVTRTSYLKFAFIYTLPLALYNTFLITQIYLEWKRGNSKQVSYYYMYALTICGVYDLLAAITFIFKSEITVTLLKEAFKMFRYVHRGYMRQFDPNNDHVTHMFDIFYASFALCSPWNGFLIGAHCFIYPEWPVYITSYFLEADGVTLKVAWGWWMIARTGLGLYYMWFLQAIWANLLIFAEILGVVFWNAWLILLEFRCVSNEANLRFHRRCVVRYRAIPEFRSFTTLPKLYTRFQVLFNLSSDFTSCFVVPLITVLINIILYSNYSMIRHWKRLTLSSSAILMLWSCMAMFTCLVQLSMFGTWFFYSKKNLRSVWNKDWGSLSRNKEMRRFVKGCKPLSFGYGKFCVIKRASVLKFIKLIIRGTFKALLSIRKDGE